MSGAQSLRGAVIDANDAVCREPIDFLACESCFCQDRAAVATGAGRVPVCSLRPAMPAEGRPRCTQAPFGRVIVFLEESRGEQVRV